MLRILKARLNLSNVGAVNLKERLHGLKLRLMILSTILIIVSGCTELALLASAGGMAVSQNTYARAYNGLDFMTFINTEKSIKRHIYDQGKKYIHETFPNH